MLDGRLHTTILATANVCVCGWGGMGYGACYWVFTSGIQGTRAVVDVRQGKIVELHCTLWLVPFLSQLQACET